MDYRIGTLISREELENRIKELGRQISDDYKGKELLMICILKGAAFFLTELAKNVDLDARVDFMSVSSYGAGTTSSGVVKIIKDLDESIEGKHVLVVEDIVDTGITLSYVLNLLKARCPASLRLCTMLNKPDRREKAVSIDYEGFSVPDKFVVGFGLDYAQKYRNLPYIGEVIFKEEL